MKKTIGILGGIGPEATAELYRRIIEGVQKKGVIKSNTDYPHIIINSIPASEIFLKEILEDYIDGLKDLEKLGVDFIAIACNTVHVYFSELQKHVKIPIINLRDEVEKELRKKNFESVVVLGTKETIRKGLYKFNGINYLEPNKSELEEMDKIIENYNAGKSKEDSSERLLKIAKKYSKKTKIVAGCTEVSLMLKDRGISFIDTLDVLANATINNWIK